MQIAKSWRARAILFTVQKSEMGVITPTCDKMAIKTPCQYAKNMIALIHKNFETGLKGLCIELE